MISYWGMGQEEVISACEWYSQSRLGLVCLLGRVDNVAVLDFGPAMLDDMDAVLVHH